MDSPRLRDANKLNKNIHQLSKLSDKNLVKIGADIIYLVCTGRKDLAGNDWGDIFASAIGGNHLASPIGIADVVKDNMGWSLKTVKHTNPFDCGSVRLISGRCSPDYSYGINDPHEDIQKTGEAVISIWNSRVDIALSHYSPCRTAVLIRDDKLENFCFFEEYLEHFNITDFNWSENSRGNLEGYYKNTGIKKFVWQPHGSQLTIITEVPEVKKCFRLHHPEAINKDKFLESIGFKEDWIELIENV